MMSLLHPQVGWLLLVLPLFWWWSRGADPVRRSLRLVLLACVVLALAQPSVLRSGGRAPQVIVVDAQASPTGPGRERVAALVHALVAEHPEATVLQRGGAKLALGLPDERHEVLSGPLAASLSLAVQQALERLPAHGGAITVVGEAAAADAHWDRIAEALRRREVVLNQVTLPTGPRTPFVVAAQAQPARAGERVQLRVDLEGDGQGMVLTASSAGRVLAQSAPFDLHQRQTLTLDLPGQSAGFLPLQLSLGAAGGADTPKTAQTFETEIAVQPPRRVLYVQGTQGQGAQRLQTLVDRSLEVTATTPDRLADELAHRLAPASQAPGSPGQRGTPDLILLDDVPAAQLTAAVQQRLLRAVGEQGMGLFVSGGEGAFGDGRYSDMPLAQALPVRLKPEQRNEQPSIALAIVVDTSGSMLGRPLQLAKQVARLAVRRLTAADSVGVVEFYGGRQWVAPMQPARNIPEIERAISRLQAQGATEMLYAALEEAYYGLKNTPARYKHLVVLSDGGVESDRYQQLIRRIAQTHVSVSSVLVGGDPSGEAIMAMWARLGQGRFYAVRDEFSTVELDFRQPQQKPEPLYHTGSVGLDPAVTPRWWRDVGSLPPALAGYAAAIGRPEAEHWLRTTDGAPLLSSWHYGAGRVTTFMSEPVGAGTLPWRGWADYGQWLSRALGQTAAAQARVAMTLRRRFDQLEVTVRTAGEVPELRRVGTGAAGAALPPLQPVAPGLFTLELPWAPDRTARLEARVGADTAWAVDVAGSDRLSAGRLSTGRALALGRLVNTSGGRTLPADELRPSQLPSGRSDGVGTPWALWPWLAVLGVVIHFIELLYRRWPRRRTSA